MGRDEGLPTTILIAHAAGQRLAVDAADVIAVRGVPQTTRLPHTPEHILGVFHHEGRIMPLVDLPGILAEATGVHRPRVVVLEHDAFAFAVVVERVEDVLDIPGAHLENEEASLPAPLQGLVRGVIARPRDGPASATESNGQGVQENKDAPLDKTSLDELLAEAPDWLKRIHVQDEGQRQEQNRKRAREVLHGENVHLLDLAGLWHAVGAMEVSR